MSGFAGRPSRVKRADDSLVDPLRGESGLGSAVGSDIGLLGGREEFEAAPRSRLGSPSRVLGCKGPCTHRPSYFTADSEQVIPVWWETSAPSLIWWHFQNTIYVSASGMDVRIWVWEPADPAHLYVETFLSIPKMDVRVNCSGRHPPQRPHGV
ncbi:hypothetical protein CTheo_2541 [Ceratobasidium theobromae]|uniref:Uncharacterized protein n=1 Tax=Ceratobasidium theobromae TaxID=1582974 RepID=A0A5N5QQN1_9AGAM|nr:hypothetical protein CTheo_2541 [Ceratobasidium theobromae]